MKPQMNVSKLFPLSYAASNFTTHIQFSRIIEAYYEHQSVKKVGMSKQASTLHNCLFHCP
jgi:hypothetical protein